MGVEALVDVTAHEGGLVGEDGLDLADLGGDAARSRVHVGGDVLLVLIVGVAEEGGHGVAVGDVDVAAALEDVVDAVGALVEALADKAEGEGGGVGGVFEGDGIGGEAAIGGVHGDVSIVLVGDEGAVLIAGIGGRPEEVLMASWEVHFELVTCFQICLDHDHGGGLEVGVLGDGQAACRAAGVAVLVVDPEAQAQPLALVGYEGEDLPLGGIKGVVAGTDVIDDAAKAAGLDVEEVVCDDRLLLVEGGVGGVGEVVDDLQGETWGVGGHGGTPFGKCKMQNAKCKIGGRMSYLGLTGCLGWHECL